MKNVLVTASVLLATATAFAQSQTSTNINAPSTTAGSINAPVETATVAPKKKLSVSAYAGYYGSVEAINRGNNEGNNLDLYVDGMKEIGGGQKLGLRVNGAGNQTNERAGSDHNEIALVDPQIRYTNPFYASSLRVSLPVTEVSKKIGRVEVRYNVGADLMDNGRFVLGAFGEGRVYSYSDDTGQRLGRFRGGLSPVYKFNDRVSTLTNAYYDVRWQNNEGPGFKYGSRTANVDDPTTKGAPGRALDRHGILELGASINVIPKVLLIEVYTAQDQQFENTRASAMKFLDEDTTSYNIELTYTL